MNKYNTPLLKNLLLTVLALIAFAANSILCRLALSDTGDGALIDAASFTTLRLLSGALVLLFIIMLKKNTKRVLQNGSWSGSVMLFIYAACFSYAYISLDTGTGALVLFGAVQISIIALSIISGKRLHRSEVLGTLMAFSGFVYLVLPTVSTPSFSGFILMSVAGIAWGVYTLKGRGSTQPLLDTTSNFIRTLPFVLILFILTFKDAHYSSQGVYLALLSGGIASAIGYTLWYIALSGLSAIQAAVSQLSVPIIATLGGVVFMSESMSVRFLLAACLVLGGLFIVVLGHYYFIQSRKV